MSTIVGIAGVSGKLAQCVLKALQEYPNVKIRGYCRNSKKLPHTLKNLKNLQIIEGEFDDQDAIRRFVQGTHVVICCYFANPEVMITGQKLLIDACENENVPRYMPSDFAVDFTKIPAGALFPKESSRTIMEYLETKRVDGVHLLTGSLMETFWSPYFNLYDHIHQSISFWGSGEECWDLTSYSTAASFVAALAIDRGAKGIFRVRGDRKSILDCKEIFERVYQSSLKLNRLGSIEELWSEVEVNFRKTPSDVMSWAPKCFSYWCVNDNAALGNDLDLERYPDIQAVDLESFFRANALSELYRADEKLGF